MPAGVCPEPPVYKRAETIRTSEYGTTAAATARGERNRHFYSKSAVPAGASWQGKLGWKEGKKGKVLSQCVGAGKTDGQCITAAGNLFAGSKQ